MIAVCEFTWRRRKLAVDEDVRNITGIISTFTQTKGNRLITGVGESYLKMNLPSLMPSIIFTRIKIDFTYPHHQASVTAEMWEEFKFAINPFAGDTKPNPAITAEQNALSRASSKMMSKVLFFSLFFLLVREPLFVKPFNCT